MPDQDFLGKDFASQLEGRILYEDFDTKKNPSTGQIEGTYTFKLDFGGVKDFLGFVSKLGKWEGSGRERNFVGGLIFAGDKNIYKNKEILIDFINYKDSMFDGRPVVVGIAKYRQEVQE